MDKKKFPRFLFILLSVVGGISFFLICALIVYIYSPSNVSNSYKTYEESVSSSVPITGGGVYMDSYLSDMSYVEDQYVGGDDRSIIRSGNIEIAVDDIDKTLEIVDGVKESVKGVYINLDDFGKGKDRRVNLTLKVEASKFDIVYSTLKDIDGEYIGSSIYESDVTSTVVDLEARLNNYKSVEGQYLKILESAKSVEETLLVYKELNEVRYNIERVEGELKGLNNQTEYSYVYIYLSQSIVGAELEDSVWKPLGVFKSALRALVAFAKLFGSLVIWFVVFIPVFGLIVVPVWLIRRKKK